ncbi:unnamed protein product [Tilletia laevis]|uniref:Protein BFR2 n=2 Tax=Tilletia TaxID=13289 RepID=A0A177U5T8_9BASI|nr:hypothetical protein CF335_g4789 [Tilletia laevis]KAE8257015.1 hypothetical protein A4X03_0g4829 [Tilletia caries]CAD6916160.1 unnamed protein product [Tilletia controversa]KAE8199293.1 hypothetical protein CF336_g1263 [Tilletia laevis]CAD6889691.1 unnamed protein product [Tilletia caries]
MKSSLAAQLALLTDVAPVDTNADRSDDLLRAFPVSSAQHAVHDIHDHDQHEEREDGNDHDHDEDGEQVEDADQSDAHSDMSDIQNGDDEGDEFSAPDDNPNSTHALANQAAESEALIKSLKADTAAAAQRGRAIKRQQRDWDAALELRIRAQKVVRAGMRIETLAIDPFLNHPTASKRGAPEHHASLLRNLDALSASLFVLRARLLEQSHPSDVRLPASLSVQHFEATRERARKRIKLDSSDQDADEDVAVAVDVDGKEHTFALEKLFALESRILEPLASSILNSAHSKLNAANTSASSKDNKAATAKFKTASQTPTEQIEASLSNAESKRRLLERTQVWRGDETRLCLPATPTPAAVAEKTTTSDSVAEPTPPSVSARALDLDTFDDSDMYSHLLRELIESKGGRSSSSTNTPAAGGGGLAGDGGAQFNADLTLLAPGLLNGGKKAKRAVDTRASKGRKIRYEVNEKIANFMPPVPRLLWDEDQIDRLFSKLNARLGDQDVIKRTRTAATVEEEGDEADEEEGQGAASTNIIDGLQLFG